MYDNPIIPPPVTYPEPDDVEFTAAAAQFFGTVGQIAVENRLRRLLRRLVETGLVPPGAPGAGPTAHAA